MADEAFALSPISARASLPSEQDYEAIREAFMETSRGRWFLGEYARRNRNADTRMVLDAVARIEEALATQREPAPPPEDKSAEILAAIRRAVEKAEQAASAALDGFDVDNSLGPIRKGTRIVREISWRWREIGGDGRICDLLDSQASAIEAGCGQIAGNDPKPALRLAFDLIKASLDELSAGEPMDQSLTEHVAEAVAASEPDDAVAVVLKQAPAPVNDMVAPVALEPAQSAAMTEPGLTDATEIATEDPDVYDDALLEAVAAEMAAPDPFEEEDELFADGSSDEAKPLAEAEPVIPLSQLERWGVSEAAFQSAETTASEATAETASEASAEGSLGATILANGILPRPITATSDPLAPIRRMSQAEKIAFFS